MVVKFFSVYLSTESLFSQDSEILFLHFLCHSSAYTYETEGTQFSNLKTSLTSPVAKDKNKIVKPDSEMSIIRM